MSNPTKTLLVVYSYHHKNTEKIANIFSKALDAQIKTPQQINPEELQEYDLIGLGSGIYSDKNHKSVLDLADKLPQVNNKKAFIFSTSGAPIGLLGEEKFREYIEKSHSELREKLQNKGYLIIDEFGCAGYNTNKFLKLFRGINKGRPNAEDLKNAEEFALKLKKNL